MSWWRGESNLLDQVGGNSGTIVGDPMTFGSGEVGQCFDFLQTSYVNVGSHTNLHLQDLTIEGWISLSTNGYGNIPGAIFGFGSGGYQFGANDDGTIFLAVAQIDEYINPPYQVDSPFAITDTNFHHLAMTKYGTNVYFYIDGLGTLSSPFSETFTFGTAAAIGAKSDDGEDPFSGKIDELSVYSRALTAGEIQAIYEAGSAGKCLSLAGPYIFDQPTNLTVFGGYTADFTVVGQWRATNILPMAF